MKDEKTGRLAELIYNNESNGYSVLVFETEDEQFTAVGYMLRPLKGRSYRLTGEWTSHPKYGEQFVFTSAEEMRPTTQDGIAAFLSSGIIRGVGPSTAKAIVKRFGTAALAIMEHSPERLTEIPGIGPIKAEAIAAGYAEHREYAETVLALSEYDISPEVCLKLYKEYGTKAVGIVRENPYQLISDIYGIGFTKADKIASRVGIAGDSPHRIKSGVVFRLEQLAQEGSTYAFLTDLAESAAQLLDVARDQVRACIEDLTMDGQIFMENLDGSTIVMLTRYYLAEKRVAAKLYELTHAPLLHIAVDAEKLIRRSEKSSGIELSEKQKHAIVSSMKNGVSVITGGPGTGKTTIINTILEILEAGNIKTALAAPTGRAAKRMEQATGRSASTVHRLLEYSFFESENALRFGRNSESPLEYECVIIDETSMVDILLMDGLLAAIRPGTRLILVGDADQLPPVGAGNVLKDIIDSGVIHSMRLTDIFRQAAESMIVVNAHAINRGEYPDYNEKGKDFFLVGRSRDTDISETIKGLMAERLPRFYPELDPLSDLQVLTPTRKGIIGSVELNRTLQAVLNPPAKAKNECEHFGRIYREGDKVMQNKNDYLLEWRSISDFSEGEGVFNGDIGIIRTVDNDAGLVEVLFDGDRLVEYDNSILDELETAFAMTVHKSQGSEFPVVVMPVSRFAPVLSTRNLLYTAVTRAKRGVVLVGIPEAVNAMVDNNSVISRSSGLKSRLISLWGLDDGEEI